MALSATCVIAGGGPAGLMCGYLLARAGVDVAVLEKHADFLRDFRGDTIHPSTLTLLHELGLLERFLERPHQEVRHVAAEINGHTFQIADFARLRGLPHPRLVFMPQWDFLDFLADEARALPNFRLLMETEATGLIRDGGRITGLRLAGAAQEAHAKALVIAADGRRSALRAAAGLEVQDLGAPIDVLWFKLNRREGDDHAVLIRVRDGQGLVMLDRGDYWQCALIISKGAAEAVRAAGLDALRARVAAVANRAHADEIASWDEVKLLQVSVDRLRRWSLPGFLAIGDAAHAMSPIGGVGVNLAIQDAVAAANLLAKPLRGGAVSARQLDMVQRRRMFPTRVTQAVQVALQNNIIAPLISGRARGVPAPLALLQRWPWLQALPARFVGLGVRPEHVQLQPR